MTLQRPRFQISSRPGFTLPEMAVVIVILGVLASIAIPRFAEAKTKAVAASAQSDLRNLVVAQDAHFEDHRSYTADLRALDVTPSAAVVLTVHEHTATGWSATATFQDGQCAIYYGSATPRLPATVSAVATCN